MSIRRLLRKAIGSQQLEQRKEPRVRLRLNCTVRKKRKRFPARVLDVSEGGLCLLSPCNLLGMDRRVHRSVGLLLRLTFGTLSLLLAASCATPRPLPPAPPAFYQALQDKLAEQWVAGIEGHRVLLFGVLD